MTMTPIPCILAYFSGREPDFKKYEERYKELVKTKHPAEAEAILRREVIKDEYTSAQSDLVKLKKKKCVFFVLGSFRCTKLEGLFSRLLIL